MEKNEQLFYDKLKDIFIGAKIEGNSGFVNLMKIKSSYFDAVFKELKKEIDEKLKEFPDFKEEMYDKLNTFFSTYFSESGSIYFTYTPLKSKIYDKIYTDQDDVILFWKTRMLYYVKTDKIWNNLTVEYDKEGVKYKINFDASKLEHKSGNEKKEIIYELNKIDGNEISYYVYYSERGRKTDVDNIIKKLKENKIYLNEEDLEKIFKIFEKQNEVDYFINKDAKSFLREQFDLWLKNYIFDDESDFSEKRLKELKFLKDTSYKIIDFVSQFEDELVKIWNKPKFVLNSNYVISLDRIVNKNNGMEIIKKILNHEKINDQINEWQKLGIVDDNFKKEEIIQRKLTVELNPKYKFLPIDTKYFKDLELDILSLFDNLDKELDGWLIHSENYQALNAILPKFKEKVQTIYIDPPFNKEQDADYFYSVKYKDATWATMLENRIKLGRELLNERGSIFVRCDYNGNWIVRPLMDDIFGKENFRNEILINRKRQAIGTPNKFEIESESLFLYSKTDNYFRKDLYKPRSLSNIKWSGFLKQEERHPPERKFFDKVLYPPPGQHFSLNQEKVDKLLKENYLRLKCKECGAIYYYDDDNSKENFIDKIIQSKYKFKYMDITNNSQVFGVKSLDKCLVCEGDNWKVEYLTSEEEKITDNWKDIPSYEDSFSFKTENSEILLKRVIESTSNEGDLVLDFFLGSGTTITVSHKLKRRWIGIEMGEHFYTVILPRIKKVLFYDKSGISKEKDVQEKYNENNAGGFFKYYDLEQYEQTLRKCLYIPSEPLFDLNDKSIYEHYVFLKDPKLLDAMELDYKNNKISIKFDKIYPNIDIAETLSNLKGKWIKRITKDSVILIDESNNEEKIRYDNIDFKTIKPLIWW
jgi:adenine specific DNA methylase Mod